MAEHSCVLVEFVLAPTRLVWRLALLSGLAGWSVEVEEPEPVTRKFHKDPAYAQTKVVEAEVKNNLKPYWKCFQSSNPLIRF